MQIENQAGMMSSTLSEQLPELSPAIAEAGPEPVVSRRLPGAVLRIPVSVPVVIGTGAIRTEDDRAQVICYDKRLSEQAYGRRMLQGLPPYRFLQRK